MKRILSFLLAFALLPTAILAQNVVDLSGVWTLSGDGVGKVQARVPGDVHSALLEAGLIGDPYYSYGELDNLWVGRQDWTLSRTFTLDKAFLGHETVYLRAEDVDTFCEISVNGHHVGETTNRFRRWEWDVRPYLVEGENVITGVFRSAEKITEELSRGYDYPLPMSDLGLVPHINLIRKPACHGGWDWGPCQMVTGFAGPVQLLGTDRARIDYVYCDQDFSRKGRVTVRVNVEVTSPKGGTAPATFRLAGQTRRLTARLNPGKNILKADFTIKNPQLWWPNGMGSQPMYPLEVQVGESKATKKLGLRKLELISEDDTIYGKPGKKMVFRVNGRDLFAKGADWIPCELFESRQTRQRYEDVLTSARDANMNMLRLWGGGQFEHEDFYELCDSLGILLWHDYMFSCAIYPADSRFLDEVEAELNHQVRRLRDHASIALWCGDNECVGALGWFEPTRANRPFYVERLDTLVLLRGRVTAEADPSRVYWPSSPCAGPGDYETDNWKEDTKGDMHLWSISKFSQPLKNYYSVRPRFCSEYGHSSFPRYDLVAKYSSPGQANPWSPEFNHRTKEVTDGRRGNQIILDRLALHFHFPARMEDVFYLSQVEQAMGLETATLWWRSLEPGCMGTIYWQLNDIWPGTSWSSIEFDGKWKQSHYHARRFFAPELICAVPGDNGGLDVKVVNDTDGRKTYKATARLWSFDGKILSEKSFDITLDGDSVGTAASFDPASFGTEAERCGRFLELSLTRDGKEVAYNNWHFAEWKASPLAEAEVKASAAVKDGKWTVTLSTDKPAFYVWLAVGDIPGEFSDNSFTLYPGRPVELTFSPKEGFGDFERFASSLTVTHIRKTY